jgi:hypothetical protein
MRNDAMRNDTSSARIGERNAELWSLAAPPAIWAAHLLVSYATAAIWCAKIGGPDGPLAAARVAMAVYSAVAILGIALVGRRAWRRHRLGGPGGSRHADSEADRHRFLGFATVLLSGLSVVAVLYAALAIVFLRSCR